MLEAHDASEVRTADSTDRATTPERQLPALQPSVLEADQWHHVPVLASRTKDIDVTVYDGPHG